jgi:hypothetical protein
LTGVDVIGPASDEGLSAPRAGQREVRPRVRKGHVPLLATGSSLRSDPATLQEAPASLWACP